jgi:aminopeptidase N
MRRILFLALAFLCLTIQNLTAQGLLVPKKTFTRADTLRGSLRPERTCYDVTYYELNVKIDTGRQTIGGSNHIVFKTLQDFTTLQIDLAADMDIQAILSGGQQLKYRREFNAVFVDMPTVQKAGTMGEMLVVYDGKPVIAKRPPWDGGFTWTTDQEGKFWLGVSCEGLGASSWWPCKDYLGDEPDSMRIICTVPTGLKCISNGVQEIQVANDDNTTTFHWLVTYPINNYNVTLNVGNYKHFGDEYIAADSSILALDYYVLPYNLEKAKEQFKQVKPMLHCYEKYIGKYPFWNDGYALVETPYLGMEHQSAIAYGNKYQTGYLGRDYSGIGLDFDYIIIHESAHEWWGNSVSCADLADMWIHEGFATYSESIYVECMYGYDTALAYINAKKKSVGNKAPVQGVYGVNEEGSGDMYAKGMLFLHTLRHVVNNDTKWWDIIKCMSDTTFKFKNINYDDVVNYFNTKSGIDMTALFDQYLRHAKIPVLRYKLKKVRGKQYELSYQWQTDEASFHMPFHIATSDNKDLVVNGTESQQTLPLTLKNKDDFKVRDDLGYFDMEKILK